MSLRVWLPLDGDLRNLGVSNITVTNDGATIDNNGKIGKCYSFNGTNNKIIIDNFSIDNEWSYGCWLYSATSTRGWEGVIILNTNGGDSDMQLGLYTYPTGNRIQNTANGQYNSGIPFTYGQWNHFLGTFDGSSLKTYINGVLVNTKAITNGILSRSKLTIGARCRGSSYDTFFQGKINDVRIYDHCLSAAEVKEISQGLVLHYKLDGGATGNPNLLPNSKLNGSWTYPSSSYSDKYSATTTIVPTGTQYVLSFDAKSTVNGDKMRTHYYNPNTTTTCVSSQGITKTASDGNMDFTLSTNWERYWVIYTQTDTTAAKRVICPRLVSGQGTGTVSVKNIKLEEGTVATGWRAAEETDTIIEDSSGYGHHGSITGNIVSNSNTPRYLASSSFNGTERIVTDSPGADIRTLSCWCKTTKNKSTSQHMVADSFSNMCISFYNGTIIGVFGTTRSTGSKSTLGTSYKENDWNHIVVVKTDDAGARDIYCNGVKLTPTTNDYWGAAAGFYVGARNTANNNAFYGQISDVRAYVTPLDADAIRQLYEVGAKIDNKGQCHTYEFIEHQDNIIFNIEKARTDKEFKDGLSRYTQANCQVTLTDEGYHIYRPPNLTTSANGNTMYGGLKLVNQTTDTVSAYNSTRDNHWGLQQGHTYVVSLHAKGQSSNAASWGLNNNMGWGGGGVSPSPTVIINTGIPANFQGEQDCFYIFTINDSITKTCTTAYSSYVANTTYLSYRHITLNWSYSSTGALGTDLYFTNFRLYDITSYMAQFTKQGNANFYSLIEQLDECKIRKNSELLSANFIEL